MHKYFFNTNMHNKRCVYKCTHSCMTTASACLPKSAGGSPVIVLESVVICEVSALLSPTVREMSLRSVKLSMSLKRWNSVPASQNIRWCPDAHHNYFLSIFLLFHKLLEEPQLRKRGQQPSTDVGLFVPLLRYF